MGISPYKTMCIHVQGCIMYNNQGTVSDNTHDVTWERVKVSEQYHTMRIGNYQQTYCYQTDGRIDWGKYADQCL